MKGKLKKIKRYILAFALVCSTLLLSIQGPVVAQSGNEVMELRTRYSQTYDLGNNTYQSDFASAPLFTDDNGQWVDYVFSDMGTYYQVQHPWSSVEFYDYYTKVYSENWTEVKIYDDRWVVEVQSFAGPNEKWTDVGFWGIVRSYQVVPDGIKLIRTGLTTLGQREEVYYFRNGAPCKVFITQQSANNEVIRFVWKPSGIVAASEVIAIEDIGSYSGKAHGLRYLDTNSEAVYNLRWFDVLELYDNLGLADNITILTNTSAQGRKAEISFGNFPIQAGASLTLDPETYYPDASPETSSVDGHAYQEELGGVDWAVLLAAAGSAATDTSTSLICSYQGSDVVNNKWEYNVRGLAAFPTAPLPDAAIIVSANLSLYGKSKMNDLSLTSQSINIYSSAPASDTAIVAGDYDSLGSTAFSSAITYANWDLAGYNVFQLNASGLAAISKTGVTKFGMCDPYYDVAENVPETWIASKTSNIVAYSADQGSNQPRLTVIYAVLPTVTSEGSSGITQTQATLTGNITSTAGSNCDERGFEWGIASGNYTDNTTESGSYGISQFSLNATGLSAGTTYYWRAMAHNPAGWGYGSELSFTTSAGPNPIVQNNYSVLTVDTLDFVQFLPLVLFSGLAFWKYRPELFILSGAAGLFTGFTFYNTYHSPFGLTVGLVLLCYCLFCFGVSFRLMFWEDSYG